LGSLIGDPKGDVEVEMAKRTKTKTVHDVMTADPVVLPHSTNLVDAARAMRDQSIGDVVVENNGKACGMVTDRDLVVRGLARGGDPRSATLDDVCSHELIAIGPDDTIEHAVDLMREHAIRRLPVIEHDRPVGILSLGDLAIERDPNSALADISAAPHNN
jgi:CBS domain-containing protein